MRYKFLKRYRFGQKSYRPGDVAELTENEARHINQDEPGTVVLAEVITRTLEAPPQDRQVRAAPKKRTVKNE